MSQLAQDYNKVPSMATANRFKVMEYDYDLISGKVNKVSYQKGKADAFYHQYSYDGENSLTDVYTSRDELVWERDASYSYYDHGPLRRMELGQLKVQGVDYAYTLQGWLKGVNSTSLSPGKDLGKDGVAGVSTTARDIMGFALHYYDKNNVLDYKAIGGTSAFARPSNGSFQSLYNGNIGGMSVNNGGLQKGPASTTNALPLYYNYGYDRLNRLVSMQAYKGFDNAGNAWTPVAIPDYGETISYDPNGNIEEYNRNGAPEVGKEPLMDILKYHYKPTTNQLVQVTDDVDKNNTSAASNYSEDIDNQADAANYQYDKIGNLVKDGDNLTIKWTVYGKIEQITKGTTISEYLYDASSNRISKKVGSNTTTYVRDASGNVMSVYEEQGSAGIAQTEVHLYGSSRLGYTGKLTQATTTTMLASTYGLLITSTFTRNEKIFELSNHLGNVLATVGDRKLAHSTNNTSIDYYEADILSASDYAPFVMGLVGRTYDAGKYRYGFNGKENDNEVKGEGNQQDYGMRIYDPRLGKFLSVDPLTTSYPWYTPYQFAGNIPIAFIDLDGMEPAVPGTKSGDSQIAEKKGSGHFFNWAWSLDRNQIGSWIQGSSTEYQNGSVATVNNHNDDSKEYFPDVNVAPTKIVMRPDQNSVSDREKDFERGFLAGVHSTNVAEAAGEGRFLLKHFFEGQVSHGNLTVEAGKPFLFTPSSNMSNLVKNDPAFVKLTQNFEKLALDYYKENKTLDGFNGNGVLSSLGMPQIKNTRYMHTVMGGTQQWNAQIRNISADRIQVMWTIRDRFGAGTDDASSTLPGLSSLYWLQHNSSHFNNRLSNKYVPFIWGVQVFKR